MGNHQGSPAESANSSANFHSQSKRNIYSNLPLTFHPIHGTCIQLSSDMTTATRYQSFCNGLSFSNRPVFVNEKIRIRCVQSSGAWSGSIRVGFTTYDPSNFDASQLPKYSCPDLASKPGFWVKALPENLMVKKNDEITFYFNKIGTIFVGKSSGNMSPLLCGMEVGPPVWAIIDIYGNTVSVSINSSVSDNKYSRSKANDLPPEVMRLANIDVNASTQSLDMKGPLQRQSLDHESEAMIAGHGLPPVRSHSLNSRPSSSGPKIVPEPNLPTLNWFSSLSIIRNLTFSTRLFGRNVGLTSDNSIAVRTTGEYCNAYIFTSQPIPLGTKVALQIIKVTSEYRGGLTFGITAADLNTIDGSSLPNNSDDLLDRSEYWVVNKDVCVNLARGDEIIFSFVSPGAIQISRNNSSPTTLMYVDGSLSLTFFFDLYGCVESIRLLGTVGSPQPTMVNLPPTSMSLMKTPNRPLPPRPITPARSAFSSSAQKIVQDSTDLLPPPLVPTPVSENTHSSKRVPPPVPARPSKMLSQLAESITYYPVQSPGSQSADSTTLPTPVSGQSIKTPSSATLDAFRQNAQNQMNNAAEGNDGELLSNECTVCLAAQVDCALYSCGHLCLCYACAQSVRKADNLCPICREAIKDVIKVFKC